MIKEREIEATIIYEKYIPYSIALKINRSYNSSKIKGLPDNLDELVEKISEY